MKLFEKMGFACCEGLHMVGEKNELTVVQLKDFSSCTTCKSVPRDKQETSAWA